MCVCVLSGEGGIVRTSCFRNSTSDPVAFWECVKLQVMAASQEKGNLPELRLLLDTVILMDVRRGVMASLLFMAAKKMQFFVFCFFNNVVVIAVFSA